MAADGQPLAARGQIRLAADSLQPAADCVGCRSAGLCRPAPTPPLPEVAITIGAQPLCVLATDDRTRGDGPQVMAATPYCRIVEGEPGKHTGTSELYADLDLTLCSSRLPRALLRDRMQCSNSSSC
jgi:hypothetical protein